MHRIDSQARQRRADSSETGPAIFSTPNARPSSQTCSVPVSRIRLSAWPLRRRPAAARSASSCWPAMNGMPASSTRTAPAPAHRSLTRAAAAPGSTGPARPSPSGETARTPDRVRRLQPAEPPPRRRRGGDGRIGGSGVNPAEAAGGQHDGAGMHFAPTPSRWPSSKTCSGDPAGHTGCKSRGASRARRACSDDIHTRGRQHLRLQGVAPRSRRR